MNSVYTLNNMYFLKVALVICFLSYTNGIEDELDVERVKSAIQFTGNNEGNAWHAFILFCYDYFLALGVENTFKIGSFLSQFDL